MRPPTGRPSERFRGFAAPWRVFLPAALFLWTLCLCFAASSLPLPHPIPPPAEDDPPPKVSPLRESIGVVVVLAAMLALWAWWRRSNGALPSKWAFCCAAIVFVMLSTLALKGPR